MGTEDLEKGTVNAPDDIGNIMDEFPNFDEIMSQLDEIMTKLDSSLSEHTEVRQDTAVKSQPIESRQLKTETAAESTGVFGEQETFKKPSEPNPASISVPANAAAPARNTTDAVYRTDISADKVDIGIEELYSSSGNAAVITPDDEYIQEPELSTSFPEMLMVEPITQPPPEPRILASQSIAQKPTIQRRTDPNLSNGAAAEAELVLDGETADAGEDIKEKAPKKKKKKSAISRVFEIGFYLILVAVILFVFSNTGKNEGAPRALFGFSMSTVLTTSMQRELPRGCIILIKSVDTSTLIMDDNITFLQEDQTTVTHKIVGIHENYGGSGQLGFVTEGTENGLPDDEIVLSDNVIGKVIWHSEMLGKVLNYVKDNLVFVGVMAVLVIGFFIALRVFISTGKDDYDDEDDEEEEEEPPKKSKRR